MRLLAVTVVANDNLSSGGNGRMLRIMSTSMVKGWAAAATYVGTTTGKLRRLAKAGRLRSVIEDSVHVFQVTDLDRVRDQLHDPSSKVARSIEGTPPPAHPSISSVPPVEQTEPRPGDKEIHEIQLAAARERAESERVRAATDRLAAEVEHLRAQQVRDTLIRDLREGARARRIDEISAAAAATVLESEQEPLDEVLRQRLLAVDDLENRLNVAAVVARAIADVRSQLAAQRRSADWA